MGAAVTVGAWAVTLAGLAVSVAGNVGHVASHHLADRATAAVPPLAAASALAVGLGVLKRVVEAHHAAADARAVPGRPEPVPAMPTPASGGTGDGAPKPPQPPAGPAGRTAGPDAVPGVPAGGPLGLDVLAAFSGELTAGQVPTVRDIKRELRIGTDRAREVRAYLATLART